MTNLLRRMDVDIADVRVWAGEGNRDTGRVAVLNAALRPPATAAGVVLPEMLEKAFAGIRVLNAPGPQQEALSIAMIMREILEEDAHTAANYAGSAAGSSGRGGVAPLGHRHRFRRHAASDTVPGVFLRLTAYAVAKDAAPVPLLAALKHPPPVGWTLLNSGTGCRRWKSRSSRSAWHRVHRLACASEP